MQELIRNCTPLKSPGFTWPLECIPLAQRQQGSQKSRNRACASLGWHWHNLWLLLCSHSPGQSHFFDLQGLQRLLVCSWHPWWPWGGKAKKFGSKFLPRLEKVFNSEARPGPDGKDGSQVAVSESRAKAMREIAPCTCGNEWLKQEKRGDSPSEVGTRGGLWPVTGSWGEGDFLWAPSLFEPTQTHLVWMLCVVGTGLWVKTRPPSPKPATMTPWPSFLAPASVAQVTPDCWSVPYLGGGGRWAVWAVRAIWGRVTVI